MPNTHTSLHYHIVFSTKNRDAWLVTDWRNELHAYFGGVIRTSGGIALEIGGIADHVHILAGLRANHRLADIVMQAKTSTSRWIHESRRLAAFAWQEGYGAFTVSPSRVDAVAKYIRSQEEHHRKVTFQEEYLHLLQEAGIEYDPKYLW